MQARFERGVLEVSVPKPAERKPHRVAINAGGDAPAIDGAESVAA